MTRITTLALLLIFAMGTAQAQIFINTGNTNIDKYKKDNPNSTVWDSTPAPKTAPIQKTSDKPASTTTTTTNTAKTTTTKTPITKPTSKSSMNTAKTETSAATTFNGSLTEANNNLPPNAEVGKCYARCFVSDQFEFKEETVVDKPLTYKTQSIPATYKTVFDTVVTRAAASRFDEIPAVYETIVEDIMVSPASQKWVKSSADPGCLSANPGDCQVMCLQEVPAVYKKVARKVVKTPAYRQEIPVAAEFKIVSRQVIDQPSRQDQIEIPATYKKVMHKELVRKGGYSEWKEILCANKLTTSKIIQIQKALKANGYDPGPLDDVFGEQTKTALIKYQNDKSLPVGNLNLETLKSLGVE